MEASHTPVAWSRDSEEWRVMSSEALGGPRRDEGVTVAQELLPVLGRDVFQGRIPIIAAQHLQDDLLLVARLAELQRLIRIRLEGLLAEGIGVLLRNLAAL